MPVTVNTPEAPVTAQTDDTTKVTFDDRQQAKIESIIKEVTARTGADSRAEVERLRKELDTLRATQTPVTPDLSRDLDLTRAELNALKSAQAELQLTEQLRNAAGDTFIDSSLGVRLMKDCVKIGADGRPVVVDENGNPAMDHEFKPLSLSGLAQRIADQRKYLARGTVRPGAGSTISQSAVSTGVPLEKLFGKQSDGAAANRMALARPSEYRRLRQVAREKGLI